MRLIIKEDCGDGQTIVHGDGPDPAWVKFEIDGDRMRGVHVESCNGGIPRAVPFTMELDEDGEAAMNRSAGFAMILAGQMSKRGVPVEIDDGEAAEGESSAPSSLEDQVNEWESFLGAQDGAGDAEKPAKAASGSFTITREDYERCLVGARHIKTDSAGGLAISEGDHLVIGQPLSGFESLEILKGAVPPGAEAPNGFGAAAARKALGAVLRPSVAAVSWYGFAKGEKKKLRMQAAESFPLLAGIIAESASLSDAVDGMKPLGAILMESTGLTKGGLKRFGKLTAPLAGEADDFGNAGEDALGVNRERRFRAMGTLTTDAALRCFKGLPADRVPGDDGEWLAFQDIYTACVVPLSNSLGVSKEGIMDASGGNWTAMMEGLANAADFGDGGNFDRTALSLTIADAIGAIDDFARAVILPLALGAIQGTGEDLPAPCAEFTQAANRLARDLAIGNAANVPAHALEIARRYASRIPALMEIEDRFPKEDSKGAKSGPSYPHGGFPTLINGEWTAPNKVRVIPIRNAMELKIEGEALRHCVGTYASQARGCRCHIFSLRSGSGERLSTLELNPVKPNRDKDGKWAIRSANFSRAQHKARRNEAPSSEALEAEWAFIEGLQDGRIPINLDEIDAWRQHLAETGMSDSEEAEVSWRSVLEFDWESESVRSRLWEEWKYVIGGAVGKFPHPGAIFRNEDARRLVRAMSPEAATILGAEQAKKAA